MILYRITELGRTFLQKCAHIIVTNHVSVFFPPEFALLGEVAKRSNICL